MQSPPQLNPAGLEVTVPVPVPARATVSVRGASVNVAATLTGPVTLTEQATEDQP